MVQRFMNRARSSLCFWIFAFLSANICFAQGGPLTLDAFLGQVREGNLDYQAYRQGSEGAALRSIESRFVVGPHLFGEVSYGEDKTEPDSALQPNDARKTQYSLGIKEQFPFGLEAKLSYTYSKYSLNGSPLLNPKNFYRGRPELQVSVPLLKNRFGSETQASRDAILNQAKAKEYSESYRAKMLLAEAEAVYWKLSLTRSLVRSAKDNLGRAEKMRGWSTRRKNLGLADESSYLQADANNELRQLEVQNAIDDERATRRRFNSLRGVNGDQVAETLPEPSSQMLDEMKLPTLYTEREDLKAQRAELKARQAATQIAGERFRPSLDVFGLYAWNGKDIDKSEAVDESLGSSRRTYGVGVRFSMPLDVFSVVKAQRGYALEEKATELQLARKEFDSQRGWDDLRAQFEEGRARFKLLSRIEEAQRKKLLRERDLQGRGRSTLFQVLQYETEFAQTQVIRTRAQVELISLFAALKTFPTAEQTTPSTKEVN